MCLLPSYTEAEKVSPPHTDRHHLMSTIKENNFKKRSNYWIIPAKGVNRSYIASKLYGVSK